MFGLYTPSDCRSASVYNSTHIAIVLHHISQHFPGFIPITMSSIPALTKAEDAVRALAQAATSAAAPTVTITDFDAAEATAVKAKRSLASASKAVQGLAPAARRDAAVRLDRVQADYDRQHAALQAAKRRYLASPAGAPMSVCGCERVCAGGDDVGGRAGEGLPLPTLPTFTNTRCLVLPTAFHVYVATDSYAQAPAFFLLWLCVCICVPFPG